MSSLAAPAPLAALQNDSDAEALAVVPQAHAAVAADQGSSSPGSLAPAPPLHEVFARPPNGSWIHARQAQESAIITAVRRQMEALDDKLCGHVARELARVQQQGDRLREAAIARLDAKISSLEALQPKLDRRVAELTGNCKGLSEEMQVQIRRIDQTDSRLWEWRHQLDEDLRGRLAELEQSHQQALTSVRVSKATNDDALRRYTARLVRLEELAEERAAHAEDLGQSLMDLHGRCLQLEDFGAKGHAPGLDHAQLASLEDASGSALAVLEKQGADFRRTVEQLQQESSDVRSRVELQEERYRSLRTLCEARDEQQRALGDRLERENWEGRLRDVQGRLHDHEQGRRAHAEQLEVLQQRLDLQEREAPPRPSARRSEGAEEAAHCAGRLAQAEARLGTMGEELETIRADLELAPRVAALVAALKDVAPKVVAHEAAVGQLRGELGELAAVAPRVAAQEAAVGQLRGQLGELAACAAASREVEQRACTLLEDLQGRHARLEDEVRRLAPAGAGEPAD